jgi:hypothetical protein
MLSQLNSFSLPPKSFAHLLPPILSRTPFVLLFIRE